MKISQLVFEKNKFDCVICLDANLPGREFFIEIKVPEIIAADGAALKLYNENIIPDYIIGDLDSISQLKNKDLVEKSKVIHIPEQESNDFEKILKWCIESHKNNILITGIHGGELDHTINNLSVMMRYSEFLNLCIYDNNRYGILIKESIQLKTFSNEIISIIPFFEAVISTKNFVWELNNYKLVFGENEGARNKS